jgi:CheY-like chemotaxis protein
MCKLIVLDDDKIQHLLIKKMLIKYDVFNDTIFSDDGKSILDFLSLNKTNGGILPEILFLDLNMPKLSGWRFLEALNGLYPQLTKALTVYVISSSVDPQDVKRSSKYSFVKSYLIKPVSRERLNSIIFEEVH